MSVEAVDAPWSEGRALGGLQKAATILLAMGKPLATRLLKHFDPAELREVARSAARLGSVPMSALDALVDEFSADFANDANLLGDVGQVKDMLARIEFESARGAKLIDVGCMQINIHWHGKNFNSIGEMFDPARNVSYAAGYLKQLKSQEGTWTLAVARYNAGPDNPGAQKHYVCAVIDNIVASGFGRWTPNARAFCK